MWGSGPNGRKWPLKFGWFGSTTIASEFWRHKSPQEMAANHLPAEQMIFCSLPLSSQRQQCTRWRWRRQGWTAVWQVKPCHLVQEVHPLLDFVMMVPRKRKILTPTCRRAHVHQNNGGAMSPINQDHGVRVRLMAFPSSCMYSTKQVNAVELL